MGVDQLWFCRMAELGFAVGLLAPCDLWPAMACWGFGIGSGFRGLVHSGVGGGGWFLFLGSFLLVLVGLLFWRGGGAGRWAIIPWGLDSFFILPNFLRF